MVAKPLTDADCEKAINLAAAGKTVLEICAALSVERWFFYVWRKQHPDFAAKFEEALKEGTHALGDKMLQLVDEEEDLNYAKVQGQFYQWLMSRRNRTDYGDKVQVEETKTINITLIEQRANERRALADRWRSERAAAAGVATQLLPDTATAVVDAEYELVPDSRTPHYKSGVSPAATEDEDDIYG